jgi:hypothetical protein
MPNKKRLEPKKNADTRLHKAPDFKSLYVNWMQGSLSPFELTLAVGQARPTSPTSFDVEHQANILMTPLEGKVAVAMLTNLILAFERQFGEVKIPKALEAQFAAPFPVLQQGKPEGD